VPASAPVLAAQGSDQQEISSGSSSKHEAVGIHQNKQQSQDWACQWVLQLTVLQKEQLLRDFIGFMILIKM